MYGKVIPDEDFLTEPNMALRKPGFRSASNLPYRLADIPGRDASPSDVASQQYR